MANFFVVQWLASLSVTQDSCMYIIKRFFQSCLYLLNLFTVNLCTIINVLLMQYMCINMCNKIERIPQFKIK